MQNFQPGKTVACSVNLTTILVTSLRDTCEMVVADMTAPVGDCEHCITQKAEQECYIGSVGVSPCWRRLNGYC